MHSISISTRPHQQGSYDPTCDDQLQFATVMNDESGLHLACGVYTLLLLQYLLALLYMMGVFIGTPKQQGIIPWLIPRTVQAPFPPLLHINKHNFQEVTLNIFYTTTASTINTYLRRYTVLYISF